MLNDKDTEITELKKHLKLIETVLAFIAPLTLLLFAKVFLS